VLRPTPLNGHQAHKQIPDPCWLEVDLDAIAANVQALRGLVAPRSEIVAVVKAQAYGLGAVPVARAALRAGATWLAVARIQEAAELRSAGLQAPILNLAFTSPAEAATAVLLDITPTVTDVATARALSSAVGVHSVHPFHLKVDTGLTRFGAQAAELESLLHALRGLPNLRLEGVFSHFAAADESDLGFAYEQLERFKSALAVIRRNGLSPRWLHLANSAGTLAIPESRLDLVRTGITLSGHLPAKDVRCPLPLRPAVVFKARLARVFPLPEGATVGYSRTFTARRSILAGLVPVGYADGLPRAHSNLGAVLVRGRRAPIIGRVSMDQCVVDLTEVADATPGDEVVLIGEQADQAISLYEFAAWSGTIIHEALCRIGPRVPRYYRREGVLTDAPRPASRTCDQQLSAVGALMGIPSPG
jgi:alanine racemase